MDKILDVSLIKQPKGSYYCQIACAQMVLSYYGDIISTQEFVEKLGDSVLPRGTESEAIARVVCQKGYRAIIVCRTPTILQEFKNVTEENFSRIDELSAQTTNEFAKRKMYLVKELVKAGGGYMPVSWGLENIDELLVQDIPVVVQVQASIFYGDPSKKDGHAVVVRGRKGDQYLINDPSPRLGEPYFVSAQKLLESWHARSGRTLVIEKKD